MRPSSTVDVVALQAAIAEHARQAGPEPPLYQLHLRRLLPVLQEAVRVEPNPPLIGRTGYERFWVVINRAVRLLVRHGVEPAVLAQNDLNVAVGRALEQLIAGDAALHAELVRLRAEGRRDRS